MLNKKEKILLIGSNVWNFADGMLGPLFAVFTQRIGGNILDISWAWAIYLIVTGFLVIWVGKISDRFDQRKIMVAGYFLNALLTFAYVLVSAPLHLFIIQALLGIAVALSNPTWYALYDKYSGEGNDGYIWGLADGQVKILGGIAIILGGIVVKYFSFTALFIIMGTIQTLGALYQLRLLKPFRKNGL